MALASVRVSCSVCEVEFLTRGPPVTTGGGARREVRCTSCWLLLEPDATSDMAEPITISAHTPINSAAGHGRGKFLDHIFRSDRKEAPKILPSNRIGKGTGQDTNSLRVDGRSGGFSPAIAGVNESGLPSTITLRTSGSH